MADTIPNTASPTHSADSKSCEAIANACLGAGYARTEITGKRFWHDCMKPILLGQTVATVTTDPTMVQTCRAHKIEELKKELQELQQVK